jgi:hypothetical protein
MRRGASDDEEAIDSLYPTNRLVSSDLYGFTSPPDEPWQSPKNT